MKYKNKHLKIGDIFKMKTPNGHLIGKLISYHTNGVGEHIRFKVLYTTDDFYDYYKMIIGKEWCWGGYIPKGKILNRNEYLMEML